MSEAILVGRTDLALRVPREEVGTIDAVVQRSNVGRQRTLMEVRGGVHVMYAGFNVLLQRRNQYRRKPSEHC